MGSSTFGAGESWRGVGGVRRGRLHMVAFSATSYQWPIH